MFPTKRAIFCESCEAPPGLVGLPALLGLISFVARSQDSQPRLSETCAMGLRHLFPLPIQRINILE